MRDPTHGRIDRMAARTSKSSGGPVDNQALESRRPEPSETDGFADDYLTVVAHDLRASLNSIVGWAELIKRKTLNEAGTVRAGETIIRQAKQQLDLINELVDTWRLLSGNLQLKLAPVDAREFTHSAVQAANHQAVGKGVRLEQAVAAMPSPLFIDSARLRQALIALLSNAIHFSPEGGVVRVELSIENGEAQWTVEDSGAAIDSAELAYLFLRPRPQGGIKRTSRAGFGRGLSLVRDLVDLHGGSVRAESPAASGLGVTFRVRLPLQAQSQAIHAEKAREIKQTAGGEIRSRLAGVSVLVVDDDPDAREVVAGILRHYGARVILATSAASALDALRREGADVIVADLGMPVEDGYDLIRQIRDIDSKAVAAVPAAALTAYTTDEDRQRALKSGFQAHLSKPVDPAILVATVDRLRRTH